MKTFNRVVLGLIKSAGLLATLVIIGACSQLPSLSSTPEQTKNEAQQAANDAPIAKELKIEQLKLEQLKEEKPTEEQLIANAIKAKQDLFVANKKVLAPDIKQNMRPILAAFQAGDYASAEQQMKQILNNELNLSSHVLVLAGDISHALSLQEASSDTANTLNEQDLNTAKNHYRRALSINQHNAKAANRLAKLLREQGKFEQAHELYTQAINGQPSHAYSYRNRAVLNDLYLNRKAEALSDYQTYAALLKDKQATYSQDNSDNTQLALTDAQNKALKRDLKMVGRWLADVQRQVNALARTNSENSNGS